MCDKKFNVTDEYARGLVRRLGWDNTIVCNDDHDLVAAWVKHRAEIFALDVVDECHDEAWEWRKDMNHVVFSYVDAVQVHSFLKNCLPELKGNPAQRVHKLVAAFEAYKHYEGRETDYLPSSVQRYTEKAEVYLELAMHDMCGQVLKDAAAWLKEIECPDDV